MRVRIVASVRGRAKRMPKAEATTGLAPKKASATNPLNQTTTSPSEGFVLDSPSLSLVKSQRSLGDPTRKIAGPLLPGVPHVCRACSLLLRGVSPLHNLMEVK